MGLDEMKGNVPWGGREVRDYVGGRVGSIGVDEVSFTNEMKGEQVGEEVEGGAGSQESECAEDVLMVRLNLKTNGGVVLNPSGLNVEYFEVGVRDELGGCCMENLVF